MSDLQSPLLQEQNQGAPSKRRTLIVVGIVAVVVVVVVAVTLGVVLGTRSGVTQVSTPTTTARVLGGSTTNHRWAVYVSQQLKNGSWKMCSGTMVGPRVVVSAAHCLDKDRKTVYVRMVRDGKTIQSVKASWWRRHPNWKGKSTHYDVGVIGLSKAFSSKHKPWNLRFAKPNRSKNMLVTGYGVRNAKRQTGLQKSAWIKVPSGIPSAIKNYFHASTLLTKRVNGEGESGDSGGTVSQWGKIVGVHTGSVTMTYGTKKYSYDVEFDVAYARKWIVSTAKGKGLAVFGTPRKCTTTKRCGRGVGHCTKSSHCKKGLKCVKGVGHKHGYRKSVNVCK